MFVAADSRNEEETTGEYNGILVSKPSSLTASSNDWEDCGVSENGSGGLLVAKLLESLPEGEVCDPKPDCNSDEFLRCRLGVISILFDISTIPFELVGAD